MSKRLVLAGLVVVFALAGGAPAQKDPGPAQKRTLYVAKHGSAKELADVLGKHFKGDAEVQLLPGDPGHSLLIRAEPRVFDEVLRILEQLDRPPRQVAVEVLVIEIPEKKPEAPKPMKPKKPLLPVDEQDFNGPVEVVMARLKALTKSRQLGGQRRIQLNAVENQQAQVRLGETKPFVASIQSTFKGGVARSTIYRDVGTLVRVTPRLEPEGQIVLDLSVEDSRMLMPPDGIPLGKDENGVTVNATEFILARVDTKLSLPAGHAAAVQGVKTTSKSGEAHTLMIVTARVVEPGVKKTK